MRVDLPAPFSPQIAWISPRRTARLTSSRALTPGKVLVMPRISRMWSSMGPRRPVVGASGARGWWRECAPRRWGWPGSRNERSVWCRPGPTGVLPGPAGLRGWRSVGLAAGDLFGRPVAGVDQHGLDVVSEERLDREQVGRDDLDAVVVRLGVVGLRLVALGEGRRGGDGLLGQQPGVLEDGGALDTVGDQLDRADLGVLPGDDRHRLRLGVQRRAVA